MKKRIHKLLTDGTIVENLKAQTSLTRHFLHNLDKVDWKSLQSYGMLCIKTFQHVRLDRDFLHATISFWDPYEHVFWFNTMDLCPLYEEFSAITRRIPTKIEEAVFIDQDIKYSWLGSALFDLSPQKLDELVTVDK